MTTKWIQVATDGSALGNPGPGGWCWYVDDGRWEAGGEPDVTNNRMELEAVRRALLAIPRSEAIYFVCDSKYTISAVTEWVAGWKRRGWVNSKGDPVANRDLIEEILTLMAGRQIRFQHVRGHRGHDLNEAADSRCRAQSEAIKAGEPATVAGPGWTAEHSTPTTSGQATLF